MHKKMNAIVAGLFLFASTGIASAETLQIVNKSKADIHHLYISAANEKNWGPDQFGDHSVEPGTSFTINKIPTGVYDLKLVDEDGTECVVAGVNIDEGKVWTVTDKMLEGCADFK